MVSLYQELLMDHYRNPRNRGKIEKPDIFSGMINPSCGDAISIQGKVNNGRISMCMFEGAGCVISQATASMLTEYVLGKTLLEVQLMDSITLQAMIDMQLGPTRLKCALLSLESLKKAIGSRR